MKTALLLCLSLCAATLASDEPFAVTKDNAFTFYRNFKRLTVQPYHVAPLTSLLCTKPSPEQAAREKAFTGPHYDTTIHVYVSPAAAVIMPTKKVFPAGAVIVKEKLDKDGATMGVGGMIKQPPGYDPANGDWEYFYADKGSTLSTGHLRNCIECHAKAKKQDFLYRRWNPSP